MKINPTEFLSKYRISAESFDSTGISWASLDDIRSDYIGKYERIKLIAQGVANTLSHCDAVHSTRFRAKDPNHLIEKIIRKRLESPKRVITIDNYMSQITDLAGVRSLHIFKSDWASIDSFIDGKWKKKAKKIAYIREGDSADCHAMFEKNGCKVEIHKKGYRSVHYIIKPPTEIDLIVFCEIQVRTLFEEAWGEIDHKLRYPYGVSDLVIGDCLNLINRIAGIGDELSSLSGSLSLKFEDALKERQQLETQLKDSSDTETKLRSELQKLKKLLEQKSIKESKNSEVRALAQSAENLNDMLSETNRFSGLNSMFNGKARTNDLNSLQLSNIGLPEDVGADLGNPVNIFGTHPLKSNFVRVQGAPSNPLSSPFFVTGKRCIICNALLSAFESESYCTNCKMTTRYGLTKMTF